MTTYSTRMDYYLPDAGLDTYADPVSINEVYPSSISVDLYIRNPESERSVLTVGPLPESTKPFPDCDHYESCGGCQIVVHQRYGGNRGDILRCKTCGRTFSSRRGGILFKSRLEEELVGDLFDLFDKGFSIRQTARELNLNRGTVRRYFRLFEEKNGDETNPQ